MPIQISKLSNGMHVITDHVPSVETVAIGVWIRAAARDEDLKYNGTAHMVEHMLFKGTKRRDALKIAEVIENVGGHMNAYTSRELTSYHIHLLKDDMPLALDVLADMVQNSNMPEDEVERERGVILQEIGMCHDTPDDIIFDHYFETAYPKQTLGAPILGTNEIIGGMQRDVLMGYVEKFYTGANIIICASGNLDHDDLVKQVEQQFTALPQDQSAPRSKANYHGGERRTERDLEQSHIVLGFQAPPLTHDNYYATQILAMLTGGGMSSRLFQEIREKRGLVYSIYSFHSAYSDNGQFGIYAGTGPAQLSELVPVMCEELHNIKSTLTTEELERSKAQLRTSTFMGRESMMSRADKNAKDWFNVQKVRTPQEIITQINDVTMESLEHVAHDIFSGTPTLSALGPLNALESFESIKARLN